MYHFMTNKAIKKRIWDIPVIAICLLFVFAGFGVFLDFMKEGDIASSAMSVVIVAVNAYVVYRILRHRLLQVKASRYAFALEDAPGIALSMDEYAQMLADDKAEQTFLVLRQGGYLKDVAYNGATRVITLLNTDKPAVTEEFITLECPNCGAKTRVLKGRNARCPYCEQAIIQGQE